jgi:peptide/nickel transport system substrate-binding protein
MIFNDWFASLSPGNEQLFYWGSQAADQQGTRNYMGMKSPAADAMIHAMLEAKTETEFVTASRALDRVIMSQACLIPLFHRDRQWLAFWNKVRVPDTTSLYGFRPGTWWIDPAEAR